jgi:parvulin-like peptidyl-prolyl isomerase
MGAAHPAAPIVSCTWPMTRRRILLLALPILLLVSLAAYLRGREVGAPPSRAVGTVNGVPISERDLRIRLSELLPMASFHGNIPPEKLTALGRTALDELILDELICQEASRTGMRHDSAAVLAEIAKVRQRFATEEEFQAALAASEVSEREFRAHMERAVIVRAARRAHVPAAPTDTEVQAYYAANQSKFMRPEQIQLLELHVRVDPAGGKEAERKALSRIQELEGKLRRGADFQSLAWDSSEDAYRVKSGDLGWVHRGRLDPDVEAVAFDAPVGVVRRARSLAGYHLVKVVAREPARQLILDEARGPITERLTRERVEQARQRWEESLRASATIEITRADLRDAVPLEIRPDTGFSAMSPGGSPAAVPAH